MHKKWYIFNVLLRFLYQAVANFLHSFFSAVNYEQCKGVKAKCEGEWKMIPVIITVVIIQS